MSEVDPVGRGVVKVGDGILFTKSRQPESLQPWFFDPDVAAAESVAALWSLGFILDRVKALEEIGESMHQLHEGLVHDFPDTRARFRPSYPINVARNVLTTEELLLRYNRGDNWPYTAQTSKKVIDRYALGVHNRRTMPDVPFVLGQRAVAFMSGDRYGDQTQHYVCKSAEKQIASLTQSQQSSLLDEDRATRELTSTIADDIMLAAIVRMHPGEPEPYSRPMSRKVQMMPRPGQESIFIPVVSSSADGSRLSIVDQVSEGCRNIGVTRIFVMKEVPQ